MDSPFSKTSPSAEVAPAWRLLAQLLLGTVAAGVVLYFLGYVRFGKETDASQEKKPGPDAAAKKEEKVEKPVAASYLQQDREAEKLLGMFFDRAVVFRGKGAVLQFWIESEVDGKKSRLLELGEIKRAEEGTDDLESYAMIVEKDGVVDVTFSSAGFSTKRSNIGVPKLETSAKGNTLSESRETWPDISSLQGKAGKEFELQKIQTVEHFMKDDGKGLIKEEKRVPRRTLRLMCKVVAVKLKDEKG